MIPLNPSFLCFPIVLCWSLIIVPNSFSDLSGGNLTVLTISEIFRRKLSSKQYSCLFAWRYGLNAHKVSLVRSGFGMIWQHDILSERLNYSRPSIALLEIKIISSFWWAFWILPGSQIPGIKANNSWMKIKPIKNILFIKTSGTYFFFTKLYKTIKPSENNKKKDSLT